MDKILGMLGVDKLDESAQTEIKEKLEGIIEVKASEMLDEKLKEEKENLIREYEEKYEEYKNDVTSKFSNFVDSVLEEEMQIPEKIVEYARKGELYSDLIEQFKSRLAIDEGLLDEEVKGLLKEAKEEIVNLRGELDEKTSSELELQKDAQDMAAALYLREKAEGLTEKQKKRIFNILEGVTDKEEIDKKFKVILDTISEQDEMDDDEDEDDKDKKKKKKKDDEEEEMDEGKGVSEPEDKEKLNEEEEEDGPFSAMLKEYMSVAKKGV